MVNYIIEKRKEACSVKDCGDSLLMSVYTAITCKQCDTSVMLFSENRDGILTYTSGGNKC